MCSSESDGEIDYLRVNVARPTNDPDSNDDDDADVSYLASTEQCGRGGRLARRGRGRGRPAKCHVVDDAIVTADADRRRPGRSRVLGSRRAMRQLIHDNPGKYVRKHSERT